MATDMGRGIMAPDSSDNISATGVTEMRTIAATTSAAIGNAEARGDGLLAAEVAHLVANPGVISSRGTLPDGTDLNTLVGPEHVGFWSLNSTFTYYNLPWVLSSRSTLEVVATGHANSVLHRVTNGNAPNVPIRGTATRESQQAGQWYPWEKTLTSTGVTSVVASPNYEEPNLADGDLLVVTPTRRYWTDFRFNAPGSSPDNWTQRWSTGMVRTIVTDPSVPGGRVLRLSTADNTRRALSLTEVPSTSVAEIVIKARSSTSAGFPRPTVAGSGGVGTENGFFGFLSSSGPRMSAARIKDGTTGATSSEESLTPFLPDTWMYARVRYFDRTVSAKFWNEGAPEPEAWQISLSHIASLDVPAGWVGLQITDTANTEIAFVGVALDGGKAPMGTW